MPKLFPGAKPEFVFFVQGGPGLKGGMVWTTLPPVKNESLGWRDKQQSRFSAQRKFASNRLNIQRNGTALADCFNRDVGDGVSMKQVGQADQNFKQIPRLNCTEASCLFIMLTSLLALFRWGEQVPPPPGCHEQEGQKEFSTGSVRGL